MDWDSERGGIKRKWGRRKRARRREKERGESKTEMLLLWLI